MQTHILQTIVFWGGDLSHMQLIFKANMHGLFF